MSEQGPFRNNYDEHYGNCIDFKDKVILDLGCDWGSSSLYFLSKGAKYVIGVDYNLDYINKGRKRNYERIQLIHLKIASSMDIKQLINLYNPDVVKADIEGAEYYILQLDEDTINKVKEWIIEIHTKEFEPNNTKCNIEDFIEFFKKLKYKYKFFVKFAHSQVYVFWRE